MQVKPTRRDLLLVVSVVLLILVGYCLQRFGRNFWVPIYQQIKGVRTVAQVIEEIGAPSRARLRPHFEKAGVSYPPKRVALLAFKQERRLEVYATTSDHWAFVREYHINAASGVAGPKLREGDRQVPEGAYAIEGLNPNSAYHLSMKLNYPNEFDLAKAKQDGRTELGGDIFIHGKNASIGCLAMGDEVIEELFTLVADADTANVTVLIAPWDMRTRLAAPESAAPNWIGELYDELSRRLLEFKH